MGKDNLCDYFKKYKEDDSKIFRLGGVLYCANRRCSYNNHVGKAYLFEGIGSLVCECGTNGLKKIIDERTKSADNLGIVVK